ncbi:MAG: flavodoxin family protein [Spirochaetales bacterium]|nr:flavodoxin family protein [Spirochaetales bacterium]
MRILVLNGSPKKRSDTMRLTNAFLEGLDKDKGNDITIVDVRDKRIAPCRGCFQCWQRKDCHCVIEDDQNAILDLYREADIIIWSFPLYCYAMPSHLKAVLDRTLPLTSMRMVTLEDGTVRHETMVDFSKKHTLVISGCGFPHWQGNFEGLRIMCRNCFGNPDMVFVPEAPLLNVPQASVVADPLLRRFREAGEEYAQNLTLSESTVKVLERPMISMEEYLRNINR